MNSNINSEGKRNTANLQLRGLTQPLFTSTFRKRKKTKPVRKILIRKTKVKQRHVLKILYTKETKSKRCS